MKQSYIVILPVTRTGKYKVCASRVGNKNGFYEVAECPNEVTANLLRKALEAYNSTLPDNAEVVRAA